MNVVRFSFQEIRSAVVGEWMGDFTPEEMISGVFTDTRETAPDMAFFALSGENFDAHNFLEKAVQNGAKLLVIDCAKKDKLPSPLTVPVLAVESTVDALQQLALAHRRRFPELRLLALTGSCGKTSTKEMLRAILCEAFGAEHVLATEGNTNNQIGVPQNLFRLTAEHKAAVIEMGTNHHGEIEPLARIALPESAMIVSIGNCHLENLGSLEGVATEKSNVFRYLPGFMHESTAVIPLDCAGAGILRKAAGISKILTFGTTPEADYSIRYLGGALDSSEFELSCKSTGGKAVIRWGLTGEHQACNAAGAAALAGSLGIPFDVIARGLAATTLPGMRMRVTRRGGVTWINDAYNANPDSMVASLKSLAGFTPDDSRLLLVLGDMGELGESAPAAHRRVLEAAAELFSHARIFTVGTKMQTAADGLPVEKTYPDAAAAAQDFAALAHDGDTVFLKASRSTHLEKLEPEA